MCIRLINPISWASQKTYHLGTYNHGQPETHEVIAYSSWSLRGNLCKLDFQGNFQITSMAVATRSRLWRTYWRALYARLPSRRLKCSFKNPWQWPVFTLERIRAIHWNKRRTKRKRYCHQFTRYVISCLTRHRVREVIVLSTNRLYSSSLRVAPEAIVVCHVPTSPVQVWNFSAIEVLQIFVSEMRRQNKLLVGNTVPVCYV